MFGSQPKSKKKSQSLLVTILDDFTPTYREALKDAHERGYSGDKARRVAKMWSTKWWK